MADKQMSRQALCTTSIMAQLIPSTAPDSVVTDLTLNTVDAISILPVLALFCTLRIRQARGHMRARPTTVSGPCC